MKNKSKKNTNYGYLNMSDEELSLFINSNVENYLKEGFNDYISKPIDKKELSRVLKKFLKKEAFFASLE